MPETIINEKTVNPSSVHLMYLTLCAI